MCVQAGWTIFFFVEIFANNSIIVQKWLKSYLKDTTNKADVARYASIAMCVDGLITFIIMLLCGIVVISKLMAHDEESEMSSLPSRSETLAVRLDNDLLKIDSGLPRLRATPDGNVSGIPTTGGAHSVWSRPSIFQSERL
ncbi:unnamed protein product [Auanema sp. JU1783]|nr:unnamed protein product [Auanema sp. JU1783]